ncbi:hypothetical protein [Streptomyces sp. NPDC058382]|uniref:hypothetical protein n=1 Tax=unclassified Streptomyces TaxID=2593676 RepID=UPI003661A536
MFPLLHAFGRIREDCPPAAYDVAVQPCTATGSVARHNAWPDVTQVWVWAGTTATSGFGPIAADFL